MKFRTATGVLLLLLVAVGSIALLWNRSNTQIFYVNSGHRLTFLGHTYGTNHFWVNGTALQRLFANVPEEWLPDDLIADKIEGQSDTPTLRLWFQGKSTNTAIVLPGRAAMSHFVPSQSLLFAIEDENGICATTDSSWEPTSFVSFASDSIEFETFPRRSKMFTIHMLTQTWSSDEKVSYSDLGQMRMKNPVHETFPVWKAEPLPTTKTNGDLQVTLTRLLTNIDPDSGEVPLRATNRWKTETWIGLKVLRNGKPTKDWKVAETILSDATGNQSKVYGPGGFDDAGECKLSTGSAPWPDEAAWKINLELSRGTNFAADELVTFKDIPVITNSIANSLGPSDRVVGNWSGNVITAGVRSGPPWAYPLDMEPFATNTVQGFTIKMLKVLKISNLSPETYAVNFNTEPPLTGFEFTAVKAIDQNGEDILTTGSTAGVNHYAFYAMSTNAIQTVDVTIAIHKKRFVEFMAKPEMMK